jgi:gliding motility-associated-like protein
LSRCNSDLVTQFWVQSGYSLEEGGSYYAESESGGFCVDPDCFHGFNGIANTGDLIFTFNGVELIKRTIADGTELLSANIPGGIIDTNSGVLADSCGYIYVGTQTEIRQYDYDLQFIAAVPVTGAVYDLFLNSNNDIVACGDGWVMTMLSGCSGFHVQTQITPPLCTGDCNASIIAEGAGGVEPYTYIWNPGNIVNPEITDICSGLYTVTAYDAEGDTVYADVQVNDPQVLEVALTIVESACGTTNGSVNAVATGGTPGYNYNWSPGGASTASISDLAPGNYTLTLTDDNGCEVEAVADVPQGPPPSVEFIVNEPECFGDCNGSLTATVIDGTSPYEFIWSNTLTTSTIGSLCPGEYTVQVEDAFGCTGNESVDLPSAPAINIVVDIDQCKDDGADGTLTVTATGGHPGFEYTWLVIPLVDGPVLDSIPAGVYPLLIVDDNNCVDTFDVVLPLCPHDSLFIPNIFTPNNDSDNDMFQIYNTGFRTLNCQIFNRWGNVVYEWNKTAGFWDGEIDGRPAEDGVYYYVLEGERYSGEMVQRAGYFHLVAQKEE